ncbi:MAG: hypothetical protein ACJASL_000174 [Paraglaciecola sp.]|jgi:hypothetical protein
MDTVLDVLNIISAVIAIASIVIKLTPGQEDDAWWAKYKPYFDFFALTPKDAKK